MKKISKKMLLLVITVMLCFAVTIAVSATEEETIYVEGYYGYTEKSGEATIIVVDRTISGDITVPSTLGGYVVTEIYESAFSYCESLTSITIPDSVESIGQYAFQKCSNLKSVTLTEGITNIENGIFALCYNLTEVNLPTSLTSIGDYAFTGCVELKDINLPINLNKIGSSAFNGCVSLQKIIIPDQVTVLGSAFVDCVSLENLIIYGKNTNVSLAAIHIFQKPIDGVSWNEWLTCRKKCMKNLIEAEYGSGEVDDVLAEEFVNMTQEANNSDVIANIRIHCHSGSLAEAYAVKDEINYILFEDYIPSTTEATCITKGSVTYTCPCGCGDSYSVEDDYNTNNHEGETEIRGYIAPTCTEDGFTGDTYCLGCGELIEKGEVIPATDHKDEDGDDICDICGADLGGEDEGGGNGDGGSGEGGNGSGSECEHSSIEVPLVNATCTQGGMSYDICSECGETLSEIYDTDALGHDMSDFVQIKAPTCTEKGEERADCSRCDYYEIRKIKELGHAFGEWVTVKYPTAKETGLKQRSCTVCGATEEEIIDKLPALIDEKTGIIVEYPAKNYDGVVGMIIEETLDETAINIVNAIGSVAKNKVYDITLTLNGVAIQPVGKVTIRIPLPADYTAERTYVYYLNLATRVPEKLDARYEDGYMVFETDHFSFYAIAEIPDIENCDCNCHASGIKKFFFNFILFFQKIFKKNAVCACGLAHY
ncbi:MAG: leucine-rich repeat domain-containing protein [Clostridia bacterium]|nr:leucine-rich repeat domain-containing protein [Clostridia bacterium]